MIKIHLCKNECGAMACHLVVNPMSNACLKNLESELVDLSFRAAAPVTASAEVAWDPINWLSCKQENDFHLGGPLSMSQDIDGFSLR